MRHATTLLVLFLTAILLTQPALAQDVISTVIGGGPNDMPALDANVNLPAAIAVDSSGNYYIASAAQNRIFKVDTTGLLTVLAGNGLAGYSGDGVTGGAPSAALNGPQGVAVDASGNVYIADTYNFVIRKVDTANTITTISGTQGTCGGSASTLCYPNGVAADTSGNLFIADTSDCQIKKLVLSSLTITVFAGNGTCGYSGDGGAPSSAELNQPNGVVVDGSGDVFIADTNNFVIREVVKSTGKIRTVAGNNALGGGYSGDGGPATSAQISYVYKLAVNSTGTTVTVADGAYNSVIRQFTVGGNINTVAGGGSGTGCAGFSGDTGPATAACLYYPQGVAVSSTGTVYVADSDNERVRSFTVGGNINTIAGNGSATEATVVNGVPANGVDLFYPFGVFEDPSGNIFVADQSNQMIRELSSGLVNAYAGTGTQGFTGDGGSATAAELSNPSGVARDSSGNIYIADEYNCVIRKVTPGGTISAFAGIDANAPSPSCGYSGDGGPATNAELYYPASVYVDSKNNVYIPDTYNHVVREVTGGTITTIAGIPGQAGYSGDGGPATSAKLYYPEGVALDGAGNIYIADNSNHRIREVNAATGTISTVAGNGACAFSGDGIAIENSLCYPSGVWADVNGNLFIADSSNQRLRWVSAGGIMTTFGGNGTAGYNGDGSQATNANLYQPTGIWEDSLGNFLVADQYNFRIRGITAFAALNTSASSLSYPLESVGSTSPPQQLILSAVGPVTIANISISGDFTESDDCPSSLPNTTTCTVYVYFAPKSGGIRTGTLTVSNNGFFNSVNTIALSGTGSAISLTGAPINFGNQLKNTTSASKNVTVKNNGSTAILMGTITLNETTDFAIASNTCPASGQNLAAKASCVIGVTFTPTTTGPKKGAVIVNDNDPTSPQIIGLSGTGTSNVSLAPNAISFAATAVGTSSAVTKVTLTNKTGVSITLSTPAITVTGPFVNAASTTCTNGLVIANLGTCIINVQFKPTAVGYASGTLSVSDTDVTSPQTVALSGTGTALRFTPASLNFGNVTKGQQTSSTVTLTNAGTTTVTIGGYTMTGVNSSDFAYSSACGATIAAGANCSITMYFTPSITGSEKATFKVYDNSPGSPQSLSLSGTGQ
ncbi:MAG TPA: choice-of-anchor D domain-containing protein [Candidatus Sulfotelmatobacter sp.]|nr:choice-of-anchor D domain-containing protein [Candidatus Sulfotelmatobacter sp.]